MEKGKDVPVHKKENKMLVKNYHPISLLLIFGKIFERVIYNSLFNYFISNRLFTPSQSGFLPGDLCVVQLLSIIHKIRAALDENPTVDVRGVFLGGAPTSICHFFHPVHLSIHPSVHRAPYLRNHT